MHRKHHSCKQHSLFYPFELSSIFVGRRVFTTNFGLMKPMQALTSTISLTANFKQSNSSIVTLEILNIHQI